MTDPTPPDTEDPVELPSQTVFGSAMNMEWQFWERNPFYDSTYADLPFHCQKKATMAAGNKLPWENVREEDPWKVTSNKNKDLGNGRASTPVNLAAT